MREYRVGIASALLILTATIGSVAHGQELPRTNTEIEWSGKVTFFNSGTGEIVVDDGAGYVSPSTAILKRGGRVPASEVRVGRVVRLVAARRIHAEGAPRLMRIEILE